MLELVVRQGLISGSLIRSLIKWANSGTKSLGSNTRNLFHGYSLVETYSRRIQKHLDTDEKRQRCQSNGHLMRCSAIALIDRKCERHRATEINVEATNPSDVCLEVEKIYIGILRQCLVSTAGA